MRKLLLTSDGLSNSRIINGFMELLDKPAAETRLVFVPTASAKNKVYQKYELECLSMLGIRKQNIEIADLDSRISYRKISSSDVIYVIGGNTFYLLHKMKESGFDKVIRKFVREGGAYVGVSAGSYVACPTIEAAAWKHADRNAIGLKDLKALGIVPFLITAHYKAEYRTVIRKHATNAKYPVRILADGQAIIVRNNDVRLVGQGSEIRI